MLLSFSELSLKLLQQPIKMAMEKQAVIKDTHHRSVTAVGYHPMRREILAGFEGTLS